MVVKERERMLLVDPGVKEMVLVHNNTMRMDGYRSRYRWAGEK
jgi:hypothetical protein